MRIETTSKNLKEAITTEWEKKQIPERAFHRFFELQAQLEPERLYMDGEATHAQVSVRKMYIRREWEMLEKVIGRKVSDSEIWNIYWQKQRNKHG